MTTTRTRWGIALAAAAVLVAIVGILVFGGSSSDTPEGWASVKDYGAKADGSSGDSSAIQKAIDKEPAGTTILFPPGTYAIDQPLHVDKPMVLYGHGATLKATAGMPYMLRYAAGARKSVGAGIQGLSLDMNNGDLRNRVRRGLEVRDTWHSVHEVHVAGVRGGTGVFIGPLNNKSDVVGAYYNEIRVMASGGGPVHGDRGSIGVQLAGPVPENASNANVIIGRVENFDRGIVVGPNSDANVLRELDATGCAIGMELNSGRTLGYGLWTEANRDQDVVLRGNAKARLDFQHYDKRPDIAGDGQLKLYYP